MARVMLYPSLLAALICVLNTQALFTVRVQGNNNTKGSVIVSEHTPATDSVLREETTASPAACNLPPALVAEIQGYKEDVNKIIDYVVNGDYKGRAYATLAELVDTYGPRMTGSGQLEAAIDWIIEQSEAAGLENTHTEDVAVPHWVRNTESAWMTLPRLQELSILGLGSSVATPPEGIRAEVLVVKDFDDLQKHADQAAGKIVVFNPDWVSYGVTVAYRTDGASRAAEVGAVASLIRSVTPFSMNSPHTGHQQYRETNNTIPTACITVEDAAMMERMQSRGQKIEVFLSMGAQSYPDFISRNTITELQGLQWPDEAVIVSGHLDSWDVGQGAMDDGGGAMISWNAGVVLKQLRLRPRRTLRTILWTGEEQGLYGGLAYYDKHVNDSANFQLILESDAGTFTPSGLAFNGTQEATCIIQEVMKLLQAINATQVMSPMDGGPDIEVWQKAGVPTGSLYNDDPRYYWFHHSHGDTVSVEDSNALDRCLAVWASVAYVTANMTERIPHAPV
ncbi:LOW QUALITY PROTEIN: carboxypeptidase Q [Procambarus clarkii]|uniref:LOW QUALITY PROTEIN: carboxypeptidase Q n=1 Tax=Procambarus clarkii TaxID=6728 RepID=UPI003744A004